MAKTKSTCIATSAKLPHEYETGSQAKRKALKEDLWKLCGRPRSHKIHQV